MAAKGLDAALGYLARTLSALQGIKAAPKYATDQPSDLPYIWILPGGGRWAMESGGYLKGMRSIVVELHLKKAELKVTTEEAMKYAELIPQTILADVTLGGTVSTIGDVTDTGLVLMKFGTLETVGFKWTIEDVKII
jgi:hypothetical protein